MDPIVQVSIDLMTLEDALPVAEIAVEAGVDWLEVGTPLILGEGLPAARPGSVVPPTCWSRTLRRWTRATSRPR